MSLPRGSKKCSPNGSRSDTNRNFERIKELVEKTTKMQLEADEHHKRTDQYFRQLRQRLDSSSAFLRSAKHDIENIKFLFQRDHVNKIDSADYLDNIEKTDEEIEQEIKGVQEKLANLQNRLQTLSSQTKNETRTFEEAVAKTIDALANVSDK